MGEGKWVRKDYPGGEKTGKESRESDVLRRKGS